MRACGRRSSSINLYDGSGMYGGRIVRDKLWFYGTYRQVGGERTVPGMFFNKNAGNPNSWVVDFDRSRQAFNNSLERQGTIRLTWQATPRNKFNFHWSEQYNDANYGDGGGAGVPPTTPEASSRVLYIPSRQPHATWQSPITGKLLAEAGWGMYQARYRFGPRNDDEFNKAMIQRLEQSGEPGCVAAGDCIPGLFSRMPRAPGQGGFTHSLIGNLAALRASLTYVTGANNMKFGYQGGFGNPSQTYQNYTQVVQVRTNFGVPNQLTQTISVGPDTKYIRNLIPTNLYAQDQWTHNRLTLHGGVRYDSLVSSYPDQGIGGPGWPYAPNELFFPAGSTPGYNWKDIEPRLGVAYDVFGNGKTAVRFNLGRYIEAITASNNDLDMNPLIRTATNTTRGWADGINAISGVPALPVGDPRRGNFKPDCDLNNPAANGECAAMDTQTLGQPVFVRSFDPAFVGGWGTRPSNWGLGLSVQHEVVPRVSVTAAYNRNWWGNWYVVDNRKTDFADYTPFSINAPLDPRLPNGGGYTIGGLYNLVPTKVGQQDELAQSSTNFANQSENWQGVDFSVVARLRNGFTVQAGTSTGRRYADGCEVRAKLPELGSRHSRRRGGIIYKQLCDGERQCSRRRRIRPIGDEPLLQNRGTLQNGLPRARHVYDSESGRPSVRDVGEHPRGLPAGGLHGDQCVDCRRAAAARPGSHWCAHRNREPDCAGHVVGRAKQQHRLADREDSPVRRDANPGWRRRLQLVERRHRYKLQLWVRARWLMADTDDHCSGAVRQDRRAVRLLRPKDRCPVPVRGRS